MTFGGDSGGNNDDDASTIVVAVVTWSASVGIGATGASPSGQCRERIILVFIMAVSLFVEGSNYSPLYDKQQREKWLVYW